MPIYLLHGFRWPRSSIRIHIILNNIDDAAPNHVIGLPTSLALLQSFEELYPGPMQALPDLRFVEQYDPEDTNPKSLNQPFAFVADKVEVCRLSLDIGETMKGGITTEKWDALADLRDQLAPKEKIGWWIVYNGDENRSHLVDSTEPASESIMHEYRRPSGKLRKLLGIQ